MLDAPKGGDVRAAANRIAVGGIPLALGIAALALSLRLELGSLSEPGPGLWPLVVSTVLIVGSLGVLRTANGSAEPLTRQAVPILAALAALGVFVAAFSVVGFTVPAFALLVFWLRWISREGWTVTLAVACGATAALYVLFAVVLGVPFPADLLVAGW